jgi:hypothetical protein
VTTYHDIGAINHLLNEYADKEIQETQGTIVSSLAKAYDYNRAIIKRKVTFLRCSFVLLLIGALVLTAILLVAYWKGHA